MTCCIYLIVNKENNKIYVGQTVDFNRRINEHFNKNNSTGRKLKHSIQKYGRDSFEISILEWINDELDIKVLKKTLNEREQYYLDTLQPFDDAGYNIQKYSEKTNLGIIIPEEQRNKISKSLKEYHKTHDNGFKGRKHTEESLKKISKAVVGRKHTEKMKKYLSKTHKQLNSVKRLQEYVRDNRHPRLTSVVKKDKNTSEILDKFDSINEASEVSGVGRTSITNCLSGYSKSAGGFLWEYLKTDK